MGFMDKVKGLLRGRQTQIKDGIDKTSDAVEKRVGAKHADKVERGATQAKDAIDKLAK